MKKRKFKILFKVIGMTIFYLVCLFFILFFSIRYLTTSQNFKVKNSVYMSPQKVQQETVDYLKENIFKVNLQKESYRLSKRYPSYKRIVLGRLLPDTIIIDFELRQAIAKVKLSEYFFVDREGILFHSNGQQNENSQLPLIIGLERKIYNPRTGIKCNENSLISVLNFIDSLNEDRELIQKLKIENINLANVNDVFLFTTNGCKINLGGVNSLNKKIPILQRLVSEIDFDLDKIQYIDLRFRESVVKYK